LTNSVDIQLAYLAGLIDGEGSVVLFLTKKQTLQLRVTVYNTNETLIDWLRITFGGCKYKVGRRQKENHAQEYQWFISCGDAHAILAAVLPYLIIKQARARIAIEAWQNRQPTPIADRREPIPENVLALRNTYIAQFRDAPGVTRNKN